MRFDFNSPEDELIAWECWHYRACERRRLGLVRQPMEHTPEFLAAMCDLLRKRIDGAKP